VNVGEWLPQSIVSFIAGVLLTLLAHRLAGRRSRREKATEQEQETRRVVGELAAFVSDVARIPTGVSASQVTQRLHDAQQTWREMRSRVAAASLADSSARTKKLMEAMVVTLNDLLRNSDDWPTADWTNERILEFMDAHEHLLELPKSELAEYPEFRKLMEQLSGARHHVMNEQTRAALIIMELLQEQQDRE
jgi:hypothetical protein